MKINPCGTKKLKVMFILMFILI